MQERYESNIQGFMILIEEKISILERKELSFIVLRKITQGMCMVLLGVLVKMVLTQIIKDGLFIGAPFEQLLISKSLKPEVTEFAMMGVSVWGNIVVVLALISGVGTIGIGIYGFVMKDVMAEEVLYYLGVPLIGKAKVLVGADEDWEFADDLDFSDIRPYIGEQYLACLQNYERILNAINPPLEDYKFLIEINLLGALAHEKGLFNHIEKKLLVKSLKKALTRC